MGCRYPLFEHFSCYGQFFFVSLQLRMLAKLPQFVLKCTKFCFTWCYRGVVPDPSTNLGPWSLPRCEAAQRLGDFRLYRAP